MLGGILTVKYQDERFLGPRGLSSDHIQLPWTLGSYWAMAMPSLRRLECVSTPWMMMLLMPRVALTWIQCGIMYHCSHCLVT